LPAAQEAERRHREGGEQPGRPSHGRRIASAAGFVRKPPAGTKGEKRAQGHGIRRWARVAACTGRRAGHLGGRCADLHEPDAGGRQHEPRGCKRMQGAAEQQHRAATTLGAHRPWRQLGSGHTIRAERQPPRQPPGGEVRARAKNCLSTGLSNESRVPSRNTVP